MRPATGLLHGAAALLVAFSGAPAQQAAPSAAVGRQAVEQSLARLDAAFNARDLQACLALFEADDPALLTRLEDRFRQVFDGPVRIRQTSSLQGPLQQIGPRVVARVRHVCRPEPAGADAAAPVTEWYYFAFKAGPEAAVPTLAVPFYPAMDRHIEDGAFSCPPCNYRIGGVPGWLAVTLPPERANAMEAVSFYLLGTDVALHMSVHIEPSPAEPGPALERLVEGMRRSVPGLRAGSPEAWLPPALAAEPPAELSGARVHLEFPDRCAQELHLCTMGVMRYLMVVSGTAASLRDRRAEVDDMLASFRLKDPAISLQILAQNPLLQHTGGVVDAEGRYVNERYGIEFRGPEGWTPCHRSGAFRFQVHYECPEGGAGLWLTGYRPQGSDAADRRRYADRLLVDLCRSGGLQVSEDGDSGWQPAPGGGMQTRTVRTRPLPDSERPPYLLRLALTDEVLVVLSGFATTESQHRLLQQAFASLRRR